MATVPDTNTFSLNDVYNAVNSHTSCSANLSDCFDKADSWRFDSDYNNDSYAPANSMKRFRNYNNATTYSASIYRYTDDRDPVVCCDLLPYQFPSGAYVSITVYKSTAFSPETTIATSGIYTDSGLNNHLTDHSDWISSKYWAYAEVSEAVSYKCYIDTTSMRDWTDCNDITTTTTAAPTTTTTTTTSSQRTANWEVTGTFSTFVISVNDQSPIVIVYSADSGSFYFTSGDKIYVYMCSGTSEGCGVQISGYGSDTCMDVGCDAEYTANSVTTNVLVSGWIDTV